jgi:ABC-type Fe3+-siderophore transport system permease subunit
MDRQERNRDEEAVYRRCRPLMFGVVLNTLFVIGMARQMRADEFAAPLSLWIGAALATYMLYSLCARGYYGGAWLTVLMAPVVIFIFASQISEFMLAMGKPGPVRVKVPSAVQSGLEQNPKLNLQPAVPGSTGSL